MQLIYNGNCLDAMQALAAAGIRLPLVFADPPDNLGLMYDGFRDKLSRTEYNEFLRKLLTAMWDRADVMWLSYYYLHDPVVMSWLAEGLDAIDYPPDFSLWKKIIWRFTFGQHRHTEFGSGHRPILRLNKHDLGKYITQIRIESARQKLGDARADARGRVPDDVWDFPRVTGNATERRTWHPTQHPEALLTRIIQASGGTEIKLVTDLFAGTGSMLRAAQDLGIDSFGCEQSAKYCTNMAMSLYSHKITTNLVEVVDYIKSRLAPR